MSPREKTIHLPNLRLAARDWGPPDGPPVMALHGWLDNAASFDRLAPLLDGFHTVALDLPGHGRSEHLPAAARSHFVDSIPLVVAAAEALAWDRFTLIGHSMGAGIASLVPAVAPERVERLVLLEGIGPLADDPAEAPQGLADAIRDERRLANTEPRRFPDLEAAVEARRRGSDLDPASARLLVERGTEATAEGLRFTFDPRLRTRSLLRMTEEQVLAFLAAIACPVLAMRAKQGWPVPEDIVAGRFAAVPSLVHVEVEGGHHVHLTHPERVAPQVLEFLEA